MKKLISFLGCLLLLMTCFTVSAAGDENTVGQEKYLIIDLSKEDEVELLAFECEALIDTLNPSWKTIQPFPKEGFSFDLDNNNEIDITLKIPLDYGDRCTVVRESGADYLTSIIKIPFAEGNGSGYNGAEINLVRKYKIAVSKEGNGEASSDITEGVKGTTVTLSYKADEGWSFNKWEVVSGAAVTFNQNTFKIGTTNVEVKAVFEKFYRVTVTNDGNGIGKADISGGVAGAEVNLNASPNDGYTFKRWEVVNGGVAVNGNKFTIGAADVTIKAVFERISDETPTATIIYPVKITLIDDGNGTCKADITDDGTGTGKTNISEGYKGNIVTLTAEPKEGYVFSEWEVLSGGVTVTDNKFTIGTENVKIKAVFEKILINISGAKVELEEYDSIYNGKEKKPKVKNLVLQDGTEIEESSYTVSYKNNKNAGKATVKITAKAGSGYKGTVTATFDIIKAVQLFSDIKPTKKTYKANALSKKFLAFKVNVIRKKGNGKITFKKMKGSKKLSITKEGMVKIEKGTKKGKYTIKVKITAAGTKNYKKKIVNKTIQVTVN